jgi:hypothetical protein
MEQKGELFSSAVNGFDETTNGSAGRNAYAKHEEEAGS